MFFREDTTYRDLRLKSLEQWMQEMEKHEDLAVRGGVPLVKSYLQSLLDENVRLREENKLKSEYLKKMAEKSKNVSVRIE